MGVPRCTLFYFSALALISRTTILTAGYTLTPAQSINDGPTSQTLTSQGRIFELGFFSLSNSSKRYLGIWYRNIPTEAIVWVANRDSPLNDTSGVFKIGSTGDLVIQVNQTGKVVWSSSLLSKAVDNPILEFLESGNLVLRDVKDADSENYIWQSFDYPGDTLLPGMKIGRSFKTGINRYLSSWRSFDDPSHGDFTYEIDITGYLEPVVRNRSTIYYRSGPWNGVRFSGSDQNTNPLSDFQFVSNNEETYYVYQMVDKTQILKLVLIQSRTEAYLQRSLWVNSTKSWAALVTIPRDRCDNYALCGSYGLCDVTHVAACECLNKFKPKSPQDWSRADWSEGCERSTYLNCTKGDGFIKYTRVKLPETTSSTFDGSLSLDDCRAKCLNNCSCTAFTNPDISGRERGCLMWFTELMDLRHFPNAGQDIYIRMASSEIEEAKANSKTKERVILIVSITAGVIVLGLGSWWIWKKICPDFTVMRTTLTGGSEGDDFDLPLYDFVTLKTATNNFSEENKLGEGGFGPVYKGMLDGEQEIAVKRLSKDSMQGLNEFKNEVLLISKLQHKNLVRLIGCCIQSEEKTLVYEYMQNKSLDAYIFDVEKRRQLDWDKRFDIILGIARGLLYLHHDSRLRIIHRDLKASNILLDRHMVPKISDFGMARIFGEGQIQAETKRVVGTYGYMSPEYAFDGLFSEKSDVFSFGVLLLEIISCKKNRGLDHELNLLGQAWRLWNEKKLMELVDKSLTNSCSTEEVSRCIHIGLLCVQKSTAERPTMTSVVLMLSSDTSVLPEPQSPGFFTERNPIIENSSSSESTSYVSSDTITLLQGR